jgi:hypothetical protein
MYKRKPTQQNSLTTQPTRPESAQYDQPLNSNQTPSNPQQPDPLPPPTKSKREDKITKRSRRARFHDSDSDIVNSDSNDDENDDGGDFYGSVKPKNNQKFDQAGNLLFAGDVSEYQTAGVVISLNINFPRGKRTDKFKSILIRFDKPDDVPDDFIIPDLTVKETSPDNDKLIPNTQYALIDGQIKAGDFIWYDKSTQKWFKDFDRSIALQEERKALEIAQGKHRIKRVVLNTERMLTPNGIPSLFYEIPTICAEHLRSAAITGIFPKHYKGPKPLPPGYRDVDKNGEKLDKDQKKSGNYNQYADLKSFNRAVIATHTVSPTALSIENSLHNLNTILSGVYLWKQNLLPKVQTNDFIARLLSLGADRHIQSELDRFDALALTNDVGPRVMIREERLERRRDILDQRRKAENKELVEAKRRELKEKQKEDEKKWMELMALKNEKLTGDLEIRRNLLEKEFEEKRRLKDEKRFAKLEKKAKKLSTRRKNKFNSSDDDDDVLGDSNDDSDISDHLNGDSDGYLRYGGDNDENNNKTPKKLQDSSSQSNTNAYSRPRRHTNRFYDSDDDDDDDDGEIILGVGGSAAKESDVGGKNTKQANYDMKLTPTKRVLVDDDTDDDDYSQYITKNIQKNEQNETTNKNKRSKYDPHSQDIDDDIVSLKPPSNVVLDDSDGKKTDKTNKKLDDSQSDREDNNNQSIDEVIEHSLEYPDSQLTFPDTIEGLFD